MVHNQRRRQQRPPDDPINEHQVIGKVILIIPKLGWISIYLKESAANAYTFITQTLPTAITQHATTILTKSLPITLILTFSAYAYLLFTYKNMKRRKKHEKITDNASPNNNYVNDYRL